MSTVSANQSTFVIERTFAVPPNRVFSGWANPALKRQWASCHDDWKTEAYALDFREGGKELSRVVEPNGKVHTMKARFLDIVADQRIVYVYEMLLDDVRISVSLVTVTFEGTRTRTSMTFTEQVTFLDGHGDIDERSEGTEVGLARLAPLLTAERALC